MGKQLVLGLIGAASFWALSAGQAVSQPGHHHPSSSPDEMVCAPPGSVIIPGSEQRLRHIELIDKVKDRQVVLLGEHHDNIEHHRWQLQMITALHAVKKDVVLGFEMFPREVQPVLEQWVAGELSEEQFLKAAKWEQYWSFDKALYMPLFHYARMNQIPMYALNVDRKLIRKVGAEGWENVPEEMREGVSRPKPASQGYQEMLSSVFLRHDQSSHGEAVALEEKIQEILADPGFKRFVESQSVWDRAMAEGIHLGVQANDKATMIAVIGSGHMMYRFGVPEQLEDLGIKSTAVLIPWDPEFECSYIKDGFADAVIGLKADRLSERLKKEKRPKLGVYLDSADGGVKIVKLVESSIAEALGLKENDLIIEMAGQKVSEVNDVISHVKAMPFGAWLPFAVLRGEQRMEFVAKFPPPETESEN